MDLVLETRDYSNIQSISASSFYRPDRLEKVPLGVENRFIQLRYHVDEVNDRAELYDQTFVFEEQDLR